MKYFILILWVLWSLGIMAKTFEREYTYNASEADSKLSSRSIAMEQVKRLLLEEVGVYIQSSITHQESENDGALSSLTQKEIQVLSAGITQTKIVEEKWNGESYYLKAQITLNEDDVLASLDSLVYDMRKQQNLQDNRLLVDSALAQIDSLRLALIQEQDLNKQLIIQQNYTSEVSKLSAVEYFEEAERLNSTDEGYEINLAKMTSLYQKAVEADSTFGIAWLQLGINSLFSYNYGMAKVALSKAWEYTGDPYALLWLGDAYKGLSDYQNAIETYKRSASIYETHPMPEIISEDPESISRTEAFYRDQKMQPLNRLGELYTNMGDNELALNIYRDVLKLDPLNTTAMIYIASLYTQIGKYDEALEFYHRMIENDVIPLSSAYDNIANVYIEKRDFPEAIRFFRLSLENLEDYQYASFTHSQIAHCHYLNSDFSTAIEEYMKLFRDYPKDGYYPYMLGICYGALDDEQNSRKYHVIAAQRGNDSSKEWCKERGISWQD